ncbi:MAG: HNH endonuclease [Chlorobiaceae bacterium]|nr:HNH endonuclease [Chlorobiaceae bacterium]
MTNKYGIPSDELLRIRARDKNCVYCHKEMIFPFIPKKHKDCATIEHLNFDGPFYWDEDLQIEDVVICCGSCNSSRGAKKLSEWFRTKYCIARNINENTVADPVKEYLTRKREKC